MKTLRSKILLGFIVSVVMTFLLLLYLVNVQITNVNVPLTENMSQQIMKAKANEIGLWLYQRVSELRAISSNEDFIDFDEAKIKSHIRNLNKKLSSEYGNEVETFAITKLDGKAWISDVTTIYIQDRKYYKEALGSEKEFVISNPIISKSDGAPIVIVIYPVRNKEGKKIGTVHGAINLTKLSQIASSIKLHDGTAWIMDNEGDIFTNITADRTLECLNTENFKTTGKVNYKQVVKEGYKGFEKATNNMLQGKFGIVDIVKPDGKRAKLMYEPIPYVDGWSLGIMMSESAMYKDTNRLIELIAVFGIVLLLISIFISTIFASSITKPLKKLQRLMKEVEGGNLDINYKSTSADEIAQLGKSFNQMVLKLKALLNKVYYEQRAKRKAELAALQSQIKPHFLYNTLDTIQWKAIEHDAYDVSDMIMALSNLFRLSLNDGKEIIKLRDEIGHIKSYLFIQEVRYQDKLNYSIDYDEKILDCKVLKLIIQPIVENAIYHGIKSRRKEGQIDIKINSKGEDIIILVEDNGIGIRKEELKDLNLALKKGKISRGQGYGMFNVNERIQLEFGKMYGVSIDSIYNVGTKVTITIPKLLGGDRNDKSINSR